MTESLNEFQRESMQDFAVERLKVMYFPALKGHCRLKATRASNVLDRRMRAESSFHRRRPEIVQFLSPFAALFQLPAFVPSVLVLATFLFFNVSISLQSLNSDTFSELQHFRLKSNLLETDALHEIRFLRENCVQHSVAPVNISGTVSLSQSVQMDGIALKFGNVSAVTASRGILFVLEGSSDGGTTWTTVASSGSRWVRDGIRLLNTTTPFRETLSFSRRPPWPWYGMHLVRPILIGISCIAQAVTGYCGALSLAKRIWSISWVLLAMSTAAVGAGYAYVGLPKESLVPFLESSSYLALAFSVISWESHFARTCTFFGLFTILGRIFQDCVLYEDCSYFCVQPPMESGLVLACGIYFEIQKGKFLRAAIRLRGGNSKRRHDEEWRSLNSREQSSLMNLDILVNRMTGPCGEWQHTSCHSQRVESVQVTENSWNSRNGHPRSGSFDCGTDLPLSMQIAASLAAENKGSSAQIQPVKSLDQLYSQSLFVVVMLHEKCVEWASATGGSLCQQSCQKDGVRSSGGLQDTTEHLQQWILNGFIKSPSRAIVKALTCYDSDVSRLVDICRARLVFESVCDLCACLEVVKRDSERVRITRIKNYLSHRHNGQYSGGFRGVILNFSFQHETARLLGVDLHICELQLVTQGFLPENSQESEEHSRYLEFRLARKVLALPTTVRSLLKPECPRAAEVLKARSECCESHASQAARCEATSHSLASVESVPGASDLPSGPTAAQSKCVRNLVYEVYLRSALEGGGSLDRMTSRFHEALQLSSSGSVGYTSRPIVAMGSKPVFQVVLVFLMLNAAFQLSLVANAIFRSGGLFEASTFRFTMLMPRSSDLGRNPLNISLFGILKDGCSVPVFSCPTIVNNTVSISFPQPVQGNGYFFVTSASTMESDPVRWTVEVSNDNGSSWNMIGASVFQLRRDGRANFYPTLSYPTPFARGHQVNFDARPPWPWAMRWVLTNSGFTFGFCCALVAAFIGHPEQLPAIFASTMLFAVFATTTAAMGYHMQGAHREAVSACFQVPQFLIMAYGIIFAESRIIFATHMFGVTDFVARVLTDVFIYTFDQHLLMQYTLKSPATLFGFFGLCVKVFRSLAVRRARILIKCDQEKYDSVWLSSAGEVESHNSLAELKGLADTVSNICQDAIARQYNHQLTCSPMFSYVSTNREIEVRRLSMCGITDKGATIPGSVDLERPVDCLDQLYVQASCLNPILIRKVKGWAAVSNGLFPSRHEYGHSELLRYSDVDEMSEQSIRWARIKSPNRAVEKVVRSYGQDVSRLIDICRQSIIFDRIADMVACLAAMCADRDVVLMRIKNRMDPAYDAEASAGYRDVAVNLRLCTEETEDLGIETHVCEVQLILRAVAEIKSDDGHQRYIEFRNLRAE